MNDDILEPEVAPESTAMAVANPITDSVSAPILQDRLARTILLYAGSSLNIGNIATASASVAMALITLADEAPESGRAAPKPKYLYNAEAIAQVRQNAILVRNALQEYIDANVVTHETDEF